MRICIYEDLGVHNLEPLALSRPAFDLWCGASSLLDRQRRCFGAVEVGVLVRPLLAEFCSVEHPELAVNSGFWLRGGLNVLVNARWLSPARPHASLRAAHVGLVGDQVAYVVLPPGDLTDCSPEAVADYVDECRQNLPHRVAGGRMIDYPWQLVEHNAATLEQDFELYKGKSADTTHIQVTGPRERLVVHPEARVEPLVAVDTTNGPVIIERGAVVKSFSLLVGPCYVGTGTSVQSAQVRGSTLGPVCRVGGEVETSIIQGYSNKAHAGFLGHSYLGEWINLGAGTQTSDLRNDYGSVNVIMAGKKVNTGLAKVGSFIGDHTKTGLNTLLNCGTTVGVFCNLLASANLLPRVVPSFCSYWHGQLQDQADFRQLFTTAATVMRRRNREWTGHHGDFFHTLYDATAAERRQLMWENEQRRLRRIV